MSATPPVGKKELEEVLRNRRSAGPHDIETLGTRIYAEAMHELSHLTVTSLEGRKLWGSILRHKESMVRRLGRDPGIRVAAMDYLSNFEKRVFAPKIVERDALESLQDTANRDALTGLYNFRFYKDQLRHEVQRARRYKTPVSLALFDLDFFKSYNDRFGHDAGNQALRAVASCLRDNLRETDFAVRYGGEEFAAILIHTEKKGAGSVAERFRRSVERLRGRSRLTVSGGVASFPRDARSMEELFEVADKSLYRAKTEGRNQISLYQEERRRFIRLDMSVKVVIHHVLAPNGIPKLLRSKDIAGGGLSFILPKKTEVSKVVEGEVSLPGQDRVIRFLGRIVRVEELAEIGFDVGVEFLRISRPDRQRIVSYIRRKTAKKPS